MTDTHTVQVFDRDTDQLETCIARMGGMAGVMVGNAIQALTNVDSGLAQSVIEMDPQLDALQRMTEAHAIAEIACRQPVADDLREIIAAIRIAGELERVGDLAKNIARRALKIGPAVPQVRSTVALRHMTDLAIEMFTNATDAFRRRDPERTRAVCTREVEIDGLGDSVFRDLLTRMMEEPRNLTSCVHLLFCSKNVERIGHHGISIARAVNFMVTGGDPVQTSRALGLQNGQTIR